jgi:hypothetical protein
MKTGTKIGMTAKKHSLFVSAILSRDTFLSSGVVLDDSPHPFMVEYLLMSSSSVSATLAKSGLPGDRRIAGLLLLVPDRTCLEHKLMLDSDTDPSVLLPIRVVLANLSQFQHAFASDPQ